MRKAQKKRITGLRLRDFREFRGASRGASTVVGVAILLFLTFVLLCVCVYTDYGPLYADIEEDPSFRNGVFYIYNAKDYVRFNGYLNRAKARSGHNSEGLTVDAELMADIDLDDLEKGGYSFLTLRGHPYISQTIFEYNGTFEGNGHTIRLLSLAGNGMFVALEREAEIRNLTLWADSLVWDMDEFGVGMLCMINYGTIQNVTVEGRLEGTECYVGGIAGVNRGTIDGCVNRAEIVLNKVGEYGAGGIAGLNKCLVKEGEDEADPVPAVIKNCVNYGSVNAPWQAGGICACNDCAFIYDCGNEGPVTVRYQSACIYPEHPDWWEAAEVAGICGYMGWNEIRDCYNTGKISIQEEGTEATCAIAGDALSWSCIVSGCVSLKGTAVGSMRHESVMELDEEEMRLWQKDPDRVPYVANNWQFDLEEAKQKLPLILLSVTESQLTAEWKDVWLCEEFCLYAPPGFFVREVSPYALCVEMEPAPEPVEARAKTGEEETREDKTRGNEIREKMSGYQIWVLRVPDMPVTEPSEAEDSAETETGQEAESGQETEVDTAQETETMQETEITQEAFHEAWISLAGSHWLHPGLSWEDDAHVELLPVRIGNKWAKRQTRLVHYRDDYMARAAVGEGDKMIDNLVEFPVTEVDGGQGIRFLLLFTDKNSNYLPDRSFIQNARRYFVTRDCKIRVEKGECLYSLARACTGDGSRYPELAACNQLDESRPLQIGQRLRIPVEWLLYAW